MKLPKLKYFCTALTPEQYQEFETTRTITVVPTISIDPLTGTASGRTIVPLVVGVEACDTWFRLQFHYHGALYILRIASEHIDRDHLTVVDPQGIFEYRRTLVIPHCGVHRFEIDLSQQALTNQEPQVLGSNTITLAI